MSFKFKYQYSQFSYDLWQSWVVENFKDYKLSSHVNEHFETQTTKSLEVIEFGGEIWQKNNFDWGRIGSKPIHKVAIYIVNLDPHKDISVFSLKLS